MRVISQSVDEGVFDGEAVFDVYSGSGSAAHPPDLLLKLALYEHCRGRTQPIQWHRDLKSDLKVRWLTFGLEVAQKTLCRFRDRVGPLLEDWHQQVLKLAVAEELVDGRQASIDGTAVDGTAVAANASRRKLGNMQQVERRLEQLEQALSSSPETTSQATTSPDSANPSREPGWMAKTDTGKLEQQSRYRKAQDRLAERHAENEKRRSDKRKPEDKIVVRLTDSGSVRRTAELSSH